MTAPPSEVTATATATGTAPLLRTHGLTKHFPIRRGLLGRAVGRVRAVDGVDLTVPAGSTVALVGESGCGKSTLGRCLMRVFEPTSGEISYRRTDGTVIDLAKLDERALKPYRSEIRLVFQDPFASLNPRMTLLQIIGEPLRVNLGLGAAETEERPLSSCAASGCAPSTYGGTPTPSAAASASVSASPVPSRSPRAWSWRTRLSARSTCRCGRRSSTC